MSNVTFPEQKLMGKEVMINSRNSIGMVRGYGAATQTWWVITGDLLTTTWYKEHELTVLGE